MRLLAGLNHQLLLSLRLAPPFANSVNWRQKMSDDLQKESESDRYFQTLDDAFVFVRSYEELTNTSYVIVRHNKKGNT